MRQVGGAYLARDAVVTGDVILGEGVNLWFGVVIRGDLATVTLGDRVNIQDLCLLHTDFGVPLVVEPDVVVGHGAIVHCSRVGRGSLIAMGAKLLSGSVIGEECVIAAGALVPEGKVIPPRSLVMGVPGKIVRQVTPEDLDHVRMINARYRELAADYAAGRVAYPYGEPGKTQ